MGNDVGGSEGRFTTNCQTVSISLSLNATIIDDRVRGTFTADLETWKGTVNYAGP